jgi:hypothetical protein
MGSQNVLDNYSKWRPGDRKGLYESFFVRGNCVDRPLAFWIKFTVFSPKGRPQDAEGEVWAVYFEGLEGEKVAVKEEYPIKTCLFSADRFEVRVGDARLGDGTLSGTCASGGARMEWDLRYSTTGTSLHFLPEWAYRTPFPKAKGLAPYPDVTWGGTLTVNGATGWKGSQNHNWGEKHTDEYAWGQCSTFDGASDTYAEMMSARLKVGPLWTPYMTFLVLHYKGQDILFNSVGSIRRARVSFPNRFEWHFSTDNGIYQTSCTVVGNKETFAGLRYRNPPGGEHACLNSKVSSCEIRLSRDHREMDILRSTNTTAFEVLTDDPHHGVPMLV